MEWNLFSWIRRKAAEAVIGGVADGVKAITPEGEAPPTDLTELRAMLTQAVQPKQLAAPVADDEPEPAAKRKRA